MKLYTEDLTFNQYLTLLDYCKNTKFKCNNGYIYNLIDYIYYYDEYQKNKLVFKTTEKLDYFLIKYCSLDFIQNFLKNIYNNYNDFINGITIYDDVINNGYIISNKFKILSRSPNMMSKNYIYKDKYNNDKMYISIYYKGTEAFYNEELKKFVFYDELGEGDYTGVFKCRTIKALNRFLRKVKLPKGCIISVIGNNVKECLTIIAK